MKEFRFRRIAPAYAIVFLVTLLITWMGSQATTAASRDSVAKGRRTIVIDAGHGGVDGGATSCSGVLESGINLDIALCLDDLMHLLGYNTIMVRNTDRSVYTQGQTIAEKKISDLKERVRLVNNAENGLLVSIHQNYFSDSKYSGAQVFYANPEGSKQLAEAMQTSLINNLNPGSKRAAKKAAGIYLMDKINCCGVLVECGFLSNPQEEKDLRSDAYRKKLCCVIASSISMYLDRGQMN